MLLSHGCIARKKKSGLHVKQEVFTLPHIVQLDSAGLSPDWSLENSVKMGENGCNFPVTVWWTVWSDKESIGQYQWTFQWTVIGLSLDKYQKTFELDFWAEFKYAVCLVIW